MAEYTVTAATKKKEVDTKKGGRKQVLTLTLTTPDQAAPLIAEWLTNLDTPVPTPGSTIEGDLEQSEYGLNFRKAGQNGGWGKGGGGPRQTHPVDAARMRRCHSEDMAHRTLELALAGGIALPDNVKSVNDLVKLVKTLADVWDKDVDGATP